MPELPEVETVRRTLAPVLAGRRVARVRVLSPHCLGHPRDPAVFTRLLAGRRFEHFGRRGKYLILGLDGGLALVVHLRMTGRLWFRPAGVPPRPAGAPGTPAPPAADERHTHAVIELEGGGELRFWDQRKFGRLYAVPDPAGEDGGQGPLPPGFGRLGIDPLSEDFTPDALARLLAGRRSGVKAALLDQSLVAGLGNIYADEALFLAGIHPARPAGQLTPEALARLAAAIRQVLGEALAAGGTTFSDYRDGLARRGTYGERLRVYKREGQPCPRCGAPIEKARMGGRTARFCPRCQR